MERTQDLTLSLLHLYVDQLSLLDHGTDEKGRAQLVSIGHLFERLAIKAR